MPAPFDNKHNTGLTRGLIEVLFPIFEQASAGAIAVDREGCITWINTRYASLLGIKDPRMPIGHPVRAIIPRSRLPEVLQSGQPLLLDIMEYQSQQLVVSRLPFFDDTGQVGGAVAFVLYDDLQPLTPLISKYRQLHQDLLTAKKALAKTHRGTRYSLNDFAGASPEALEVKRRARLAAGRDMPVLLLGETGTGKEVLAQAVHSLSSRTDAPFVGVNVAAIPENLLEAEFFGVAPGAFAGADRRMRKGKFELAHGGTLFLDEVGDMSLALQAKLLRVLQEREIEPLGSNQVIPVDVRLIAATSRDLDAMVAEGGFRSDLYYRLNVLEISIPPLRARLSDIGVLCETLLEDICTGQALRAEVTDAAINVLECYDWPGNIRELRNVLERAFTMSEDSGILDADAIDQVLPKVAGGAVTSPLNTAARPLAEVLAEAEAAAIGVALKNCNSNRSKAARLLGISRSALYEKLAKLS